MGRYAEVYIATARGRMKDAYVPPLMGEFAVVYVAML
jgi:hypothetical protein